MFWKEKIKKPLRQVYWRYLWRYTSWREIKMFFKKNKEEAGKVVRLIYFRFWTGIDKVGIVVRAIYYQTGIVVRAIYWFLINRISASLRRMYWKCRWWLDSLRLRNPRRIRGVKKIMRAQQNLRRGYDVIVVSFGGCGSTGLIDFLKEKHYVVNSWDNSDFLKHLGSPPGNASDRYIYLFGDPLASVISFYHRTRTYNRRFADIHSFTMETSLGRPTFTSVANTLEKYAEEGQERFLLEQQFDNWFNARLSRPILFMRYETMWDNLEVLFDFVGLLAACDDFPEYQPRQSSIDTLSPEVLAVLNRMYGKFTHRLNALPDCVLREPGSFPGAP